MLDAYIIDAIRDSDRRRDDQRPHVVLEIDPPERGERARPDPEDSDSDGPIIIPLRSGLEEDDAA